MRGRRDQSARYPKSPRSANPWTFEAASDEGTAHSTVDEIAAQMNVVGQGPSFRAIAALRADSRPCPETEVWSRRGALALARGLLSTVAGPRRRLEFNGERRSHSLIR